MNPTPTEQQAVKEAANRICSCESDYCTKKANFNEGVQWAKENLLQPFSESFLEWAAWNYEQSSGGGNKWLKRKENPIRFYTTSELYSIYNEQLNKQQDEPV